MLVVERSGLYFRRLAAGKGGGDSSDCTDLVGELQSGILRQAPGMPPQYDTLVEGYSRCRVAVMESMSCVPSTLAQPCDI